MFWREEKKIRFFHECHAIFDFLGKWLLNCICAGYIIRIANR